MIKYLDINNQDFLLITVPLLACLCFLLVTIREEREEREEREKENEIKYIPYVKK
jgi:hypothetical protein